MGILSHFFAYMAADVAREARKEKEKNKKWNATFSMLQQKERALQNYLDSVGCSLIYIFDANVIDNGSVASEVRKMEKIKKDIEEYLALGGDIKGVFDFDQIERQIGVLHYLRKIGQVHRQLEFLHDNKYSVEDKINAEEIALAKQIELFREEQKAARNAKIIEMVRGNIDTLSGVDFENVCQQLIETMGFTTETTKVSGDGGIDLLAHNYQPLISGKYIIQCKRYSGSVGEPIIRDLYGVMMSERANKGVLMTTGYFTRSAIAFAEGKPIELIDGTKIKELLVQYGLRSEGDFLQSSNEAIIVEEFNPSAFMGYYYDGYLKAKSRVDNDPGDIRSRCKLVEIIQDAITMRLYLFELGDNGTYVINPHDIQGMVQLLRDNLQSIIRFDNSMSPNKRLKTVYYISMLMDGEAAILSGDFVSGAERYCKVLKEWEELKEEEITTVQILYSLFGIFRLAGCSEMIDKYHAKYASLIQQQKDFYAGKRSLLSLDGFGREQLEVINNPHDVTQFIVMSVENFYDECVDNWGEINIHNGFCRIDVNREKRLDVLLWQNEMGNKKSRDGSD